VTSPAFTGVNVTCYMTCYLVCKSVAAESDSEDEETATKGIIQQVAVMSEM